MAKDRQEAEGSFTVSGAKKKASEDMFLVFPRYENSVEMGKLNETLRGAVGFGWQLGVHCREGVTSQVFFFSSGQQQRNVCSVPNLTKKHYLADVCSLFT